MPIPQLKIDALSKSLALYFEHSSCSVATVKAHSQNPCSLVFSEVPPSIDTLQSFLLEEVNHGYVVYNHSLYYVNQDPESLEKIIDNDANTIRKIRRTICANSDQSIYLLPSQLSNLSELSGHQIIEDFCQLKLENGSVRYRFNHENWETLSTDGTLHPIIKLIFNRISEFNASVAERKGNWPSLFKMFDWSSSKKNASDNEHAFALPKKTFIQALLTPLHWLNQALKAVLSFIFLDNIIIKHTIGRVIAAIANHGNPHYATEPATVKGILGPIIFPGGFKKPQIDNNGRLYLDQILSKQYYDAHYFEKNRRQLDNAIIQSGIDFTEFSIPMSSGHHNNGIEGSNALAQSLMTQGKENKVLHILWFTGNGGCYQSNLEEMAQVLHTYNEAHIPVKIIGFNYPGVLSSDPPTNSAQRLIDYGIAHVERLKNKHIPCDNILLNGSSLGGSIASHVASFYHQRNETLGGLNVACTFSSTTNVGLSYIEKLPYVGFFLAVILRPILAFGLWGTSWQLDTAKHFASIPEKNKHYTVTKTPGSVHKLYKKHGMNIIDDDVISYGSSLHNSWRLRFKRWCIRNLGLFGYNQNHYPAMSATKKLLPALCDSNPTTADPLIGTLSHHHCAHSDISHGASKASQNIVFQLLTRSPHTDSPSGKQISTGVKSKDGVAICIPTTGQTFAQNAISFSRYRAEEAGIIEATASPDRFGRFFDAASSVPYWSKSASRITENLLYLTP